jgi:hypothetical protein
MLRLRTVYEDLPLGSLDEACKHLDRALVPLAQRHFCYALLGEKFNARVLPIGQWVKHPRDGMTVEAHWLKCIQHAPTSAEVFMEYGASARCINFV